MTVVVGWMLKVTRGDARGVIAAIILLLVGASAFVRVSDRARQLDGLLERLSPEVQLAVLSDGQGASAALLSVRQFIGSVLGLQVLDLPAAVRPVAVFTLAGSDGTEDVVLVDRVVAARAGLAGERLGIFVALGAAAPRLLSPRGQEPEVLPSSVRRFLRRSARGVRILVRPSWVLQRVPVFAAPAASNNFLALRVDRNPHAFHIEGLAPNPNVVSGSVLAPHPKRSGRPVPRTFLRRVPEEALGVFDGVPVAQLVPDELPPLLAALKSESGVAAELTALARAFLQASAAIVLEHNPDGFPHVSIGLSLPPSLTAGEAEELVRALFTKRLALVGAVTEKLRVDGRIIIHQKLARGGARAAGGRAAPRAIEETRDGSRRVLRAPHAAGAADLVAVFDERVIVLGTSRAAAERVAGLLQLSAPGEDSEIRLFLDGARLRQLPAVALALRGVSGNFRPWLEALRTVAFRLRVRAEIMEGAADIEIGLNSIP